jgi:hypothetical protein
MATSSGSTAAPAVPHNFKIHPTELEMQFIVGEGRCVQDKRLVLCSTTTLTNPTQFTLWVDECDLVRYVLNGLTTELTRPKAAERKVYKRLKHTPRIMVPSEHVPGYLRACYHPLGPPRGVTKVNLFQCDAVVATCQDVLMEFVHQDMEAALPTANKRFENWQQAVANVRDSCTIHVIDLMD